jgi:group II intron reverse transcriptase/maturase
MMEQRFLPTMSPGLVRVAEAAQRNRGRLLSLAHHIDVEALKRAYTRIRGNAAVGVDGVTKQAYGENLEDNLRDLHQRLKTMRYRHQPIRRVYIDKEGGKKRPLGISCTEDKIVQDSLRELLEAVYEQDFLPCSHGFRPGRSGHDALRAFDEAARYGGASWVLEADIVSFFDRIDRKKLMDLLQRRCADKSLLRLVGKCLHVGILEDGGIVSPEMGTAQGSTLSPLLANVYLHYVLDLWFEQEVKGKLRGKATLIRYADDFVIACSHKEDAQQVHRWLVSRMADYGLELHPDKTRLVDFRRPPSDKRGGKGPGTFDFLGFTVLWSRSSRGKWYIATHTRVSRLRRARTAIHAWCKSHRHLPIEEQHAALVRRIQGHFNYFDVRGNIRRVRLLVREAERSWHKWLNRRSQRSTMSWQRFKALLRDYPLPVPSSPKVLWGNAL